MAIFFFLTPPLRFLVNLFFPGKPRKVGKKIRKESKRGLVRRPCYLGDKGAKEVKSIFNEVVRFFPPTPKKVWNWEASKKDCWSIVSNVIYFPRSFLKSLRYCRSSFAWICVKIRRCFAPIFCHSLLLPFPSRAQPSRYVTRFSPSHADKSSRDINVLSLAQLNKERGNGGGSTEMEWGAISTGAARASPQKNGVRLNISNSLRNFRNRRRSKCGRTSVARAGEFSTGHNRHTPLRRRSREESLTFVNWQSRQHATSHSFLPGSLVENDRGGPTSGRTCRQKKI